MKNEYVLLDWPDYQEYMEHPDWDKESSACMTESHPSAVFVSRHIIEEVDKNPEKYK